MITKLRIALVVVGATFSPGSLPNVGAWMLASSNKPGDLGSVGRYRAKPLPYGSATLTPTKASVVDFDEVEVSQFLAEVPRNLEAIRNAGGEDIHLDIAITYRDQCNFEISPTALDLLGKLGLTVSVSCLSE
jgi:hypothetical protein